MNKDEKVTGFNNSIHLSKDAKEIVVTGHKNVVLGEDTKFIATGICLNSDIIPLEEKIKDPNNPINKCIFCRNNNKCYFSGECNNKKPFENDFYDDLAIEQKETM